MLIPQRASTIYPLEPNGADIELVCTTREGGTFYCKSDKPGRPIRATEMLATRLAGHVAIPTPYCSVIEMESGELLFGSLAASVVSEFEAQAFLTRKQVDELGSPTPWLGQHLSRLYAFDLFIANPDRSLRNFLLESDSRRLCAFDFASADLSALSTDRFPVEQTPTMSIGKVLRLIHGFDVDAALEMVKRLEAIPVQQIRTILNAMPSDWLHAEKKEELCAVWGETRGGRIEALRAGLGDGSLL
jgi:hypothetical protein